MTKNVSCFTNSKKDFFLFYFRFTSGDRYFHITKSGNSFTYEASHEIVSHTKRDKVANAISDIYFPFKNLLVYSGVITQVPTFELFPLEDNHVKDINAKYLPFGDITYVKNELKSYKFGDYKKFITLSEPRVDRVSPILDGWTDEDNLLNQFYKKKTSYFVKPKIFDDFLLVYRYVTDGALLLEGNFGVGKSFMVEALSGFDIPVVSKTIISSEREGDLLGKVTALEDGNVGVVLSPIVAGLKNPIGYTVSAEEPNVNEFAQSLRQTFDGTGYATIVGRRHFINPQSLLVFSINSRRFVGTADKVTKDIDNRFGSRIAFSMTYPDLTADDITQRLTADGLTPFDWKSLKDSFYFPNRNIRYEDTLKEFFEKLSDFATRLCKDEYGSKFSAYYQPGMVTKYVKQITTVQDLTFVQFEKVILMATLEKIKWNSINETAMLKTIEDIKLSINWKHMMNIMWGVYPFKFFPEIIKDEVAVFGEDDKSLDLAPKPQVSQPEEPKTVNVKRDWQSLADSSLEDDADNAI